MICGLPLPQARCVFTVQYSGNACCLVGMPPLMMWAPSLSRDDIREGFIWWARAWAGCLLDKVPGKGEQSLLGFLGSTLSDSLVGSQLQRQYHHIMGRMVQGQWGAGCCGLYVVAAAFVASASGRERSSSQGGSAKSLPHAGRVPSVLERLLSTGSHLLSSDPALLTLVQFSALAGYHYEFTVTNVTGESTWGLGWKKTVVERKRHKCGSSGSKVVFVRPCTHSEGHNSGEQRRVAPVFVQVCFVYSSQPFWHAGFTLLQIHCSVGKLLNITHY